MPTPSHATWVGAGVSSVAQLEGPSLPLVFSCWVYSVVHSAARSLTMPETPPGFGWVCQGWDGLFYVSMTEYNDYERNKAVGQACLTFCVLTDKVFGEAVCSKFLFQLPSHQCQLPHSDPMNHWFVCVIKHLWQRRAQSTRSFTWSPSQGRRMCYWGPVPPQSQKGVFIEICHSLMEALMWQSQSQTCQYFKSSITQLI